MELNYDKIDDVVVENIDQSDYPDFCDAYIASAKYEDENGNYRELTEEELEGLDNGWVLEQVHDWVH